MSNYEKYKSMLTEIGGWDNSLVNVNAGAVKTIIKEVGQLEAKAKEQADEIKVLRHIRDEAYGIIKALKDKQDD